MAELTGLEPAASGVTGQRSNRLNYNSKKAVLGRGEMAELTGLEPAASGVTGQRSNRLNYNSKNPDPIQHSQTSKRT